MNFFLLIALFDTLYAYQHTHTTTVERLHQIADEVNRSPTTWKAHKIHSNASNLINFYLGASSGEPSLGVINDQSERANYCEDNGLPKHFDARLHWPKCRTIIGNIVDQSNCASSWAMSVASAFSDRVCIKSNGKIRAQFSAQQLVSCCHQCISHGNHGCAGGYTAGAWSYMKKNGLVTGGDYDSNQGCQPYLLPQCEHSIDGSRRNCQSLPKYRAPKCHLQCYNDEYQVPFEEDGIKVEKYYNIASCAAMNEIYRHGPITARVIVYEDFYTYESGVYQYKTGKFSSFQFVRIIGWGEENDVPYWIVANSWNDNWGDRGFIKIKRGNNEILIEDYMIAGLPKL